MSIVKLAPKIKCYPWGGKTFESKYGWNSEDVIAQGWLLSAIKDNESEVITGPYGGSSFSEYLKLNPESVGTLGKDFPDFPLSIKMIDNQQPSVIQVNPDKERESIFYIVEAAPDATIHFGPQKDITSEELRAAIKDGSIAKLLKEVKVKAGDVFHVEAGIAYGIGADIQILDTALEAPLKEYEPQEVVDAIRLSPVEQNFKASEFVESGEMKAAQLGRTAFFTEQLVKLNGSMDIKASEESFEALVVLDGNAVINAGDDETLHINPGDCLYIGADSGPYKITGNVEFVQVHLIPQA